MAAFNGLERLGFIEITKKGYFDRNHFHGKVTRFIAKGDLLAKLSELKAHPAITKALQKGGVHISHPHMTAPSVLFAS